MTALSGIVADADCPHRLVKQHVSVSSNNYWCHYECVRSMLSGHPAIVASVGGDVAPLWLTTVFEAPPLPQVRGARRAVNAKTTHLQHVSRSQCDDRVSWKPRRYRKRGGRVEQSTQKRRCCSSVEQSAQRHFDLTNVACVSAASGV